MKLLLRRECQVWCLIVDNRSISMGTTSLITALCRAESLFPDVEPEVE